MAMFYWCEKCGQELPEGVKGWCSGCKRQRYGKLAGLGSKKVKEEAEAPSPPLTLPAALELQCRSERDRALALVSWLHGRARELRGLRQKRAWKLYYETVKKLEEVLK